MKPLTAAELAAVADLVENRVAGGMIQKISQPTATRFVFRIHTPRVGTTNLLLDLDPAHPRFHPTHRSFSNPPQAPPFCLLLRKLLKNARIQTVRCEEGDRIVVMTATVARDGPPQQHRLIAELIPARTAFFVTDSAGTILALNHAVETRDRTLHRGQHWSPPMAPPAPHEDAAPFADLTPEEIFEQLDADLPAAGEPLRRALSQAVQKAITRQAKRIAKIQQDIRRLDADDSAGRFGELLKTSMDQVERGMTSVRLRDWTRAEDDDDAWVDVPLDAKLSPRENLEALFKKARRSARGRETAAARLTEQQGRMRRLTDLRDEIEHADIEALDALLGRARDLGLKVQPPKTGGGRRKAATPGPRRPYHVFHSKDGIEIRVGRSAADNDVLTFRHADGNDWWLHVQNHAGSHVVVRCRDDLPEQTLLDAATLAVLYSKGPKKGKVPVSYTRRKWVSKFKGAAAGKVLLKRHKTIVVRMEDERVARLKSPVS